MTYLHAPAFVFVNQPHRSPSPPSADTPLWRFTGSRLTTYSGVHGTLAGPWTTSKIIVTTTSTPSGTVIASPSALSNGGRDFTAWSPRPAALSYTSAYAGYQVGGGRSFRYVATRLTMPPSPQPAGNAATAAIALVHNGAAVAPAICPHRGQPVRRARQHQLLDQRQQGHLQPQPAAR